MSNYMIDLELIFVYVGKREQDSFFFPIQNSVVLATLLKGILYPTELIWHLYEKLTDYISVGLLLYTLSFSTDLVLYPAVLLSTSFLLSNCLDSCSFGIRFEIR